MVNLAFGGGEARHSHTADFGGGEARHKYKATFGGPTSMNSKGSKTDHQAIEHRPDAGVSLGSFFSITQRDSVAR